MYKVCVFSLQSEKRSSNFMYLMVEFPRVKSGEREYSIVYYEKVHAFWWKLHFLSQDYFDL